jgi:hypothetical protein
MLMVEPLMARPLGEPPIRWNPLTLRRGGAPNRPFSRRGLLRSLVDWHRAACGTSCNDQKCLYDLAV